MKQYDFTEKIARFATRCLFFLYPVKCAVCGAIGYGELCPDCKAKLENAFDPRAFLANGGNSFADAMFTLFPYENYAVKKLLLDWKREEFWDLPVIFTPFLENALRKKLLPARIHRIAYLPRRTFARTKAGFDQAEKIAAIVAELTNLPLEPLLIRQGHAKPQRKAKYKKREKNIHGAFRAAKSLNGESILLIDDIVTTGATAREGARILKKAGAMKVYILSLAH